MGMESGAAGRPLCPHLQRHGRWRRRARRRVYRPAATGRGTASGGGGHGVVSTALHAAVKAQPVGEEGRAACLRTCPQLQGHGWWRGRAERRADLSIFSGKDGSALRGEGTDGGTAVQKEESAGVPPSAKERTGPSGGKIFQSRGTAAGTPRSRSHGVAERHGGRARTALVAPRRTPPLDAARLTVGSDPICWNSIH